ncbi:MAG: hypothetical protein GY782_05625 [Gammaproteobacteria bacterium]|nr:hypothetical protein [Gammaproteobacteria bacterium]
MAPHYSPKAFLRKFPNKLLQQYFAQAEVLLDFDYALLTTETQIQPLYEAWLSLPDEQRNPIEQDFQTIHNMASSGGIQAVIDESHWHNDSLADQFTSFSGHEESALWTFLERRNYWEGATAFYHADQQAPTYWQKRKNLPQQPANTGEQAIKTLTNALSQHFHMTQGRGKQCHIDCYRRYERDYFFAYPADYAQASIDWQDNQLKRRPHHPAFEVIFIYCENAGTLDIYLPGANKKRLVPELQRLFAQIILGVTLEEDHKDQRIYHLEQLKSREFQFIYDPCQPIVSVVVDKLRLSLHNGRVKQKIVVEADTLQCPNALYDLLAMLNQSIPLHHTTVTQAGIKVVLQHPTKPEKTYSKSFQLTAPDKCNLKQDTAHMVTIHKMLVASGLEPMPIEEPINSE